MRVVVVLLVLVGAALAWRAVVPGDGRPLREPERAQRPAGPAPEQRPRKRRRLRIARCPAQEAGCREAVGRVIAVEAVDPDGDGDAHYVLAGGSITAPGLSVVDVPKDLRPTRLPRIGDEVSAAGPVFEGSYGQRQIQAIRVYHRRVSGK